MTQRILLIRAGAFGDMIMMTALYQALAARAKDAGQAVGITVVTTGGWAQPVLERSPHVVAWHRLASMNKPFLLAGDKRKLARQLRQERFDALW
ncbi:MAG: glycosyltransferase family 9 protein, partial [Sphaerospermopsis sp. SIO1G2]|nr:glycosyltransferase family 9 protein [Sphaerospermopsis sp. SIO1G2]